MARQGPRLHRLPQRLDYILIPAPLDLSLPSITEKSALPAIIVTPSSPIHTHDFSIAFLASPPKQTLRERFENSVHNFAENFEFSHSRPLRTFIVLTLFFFIMITIHLITHGIAVYSYPRIGAEVFHHGVTPDSTFKSWAPRSNVPSDGGAQVGFFTWVGFELRKVWGIGGGVAIEEFVIKSTVSEESGPLSGVE